MGGGAPKVWPHPSGVRCKPQATLWSCGVERERGDQWRRRAHAPVILIRALALPAPGHTAVSLALSGGPHLAVSVLYAAGLEGGEGGGRPVRSTPPRRPAHQLAHRAAKAPASRPTPGRALAAWWPDAARRTTPAQASAPACLDSARRTRYGIRSQESRWLRGRQCAEPATGREAKADRKERARRAHRWWGTRTHDDATGLPSSM